MWVLKQNNWVWSIIVEKFKCKWGGAATRWGLEARSQRTQSLGGAGGQMGKFYSPHPATGLFISSYLARTGAPGSHLRLLIWWSCYQMGFGSKKPEEPVPRRCKTTDGKKWRCSKEAYGEPKYYDIHMYRGQNTSFSALTTLGFQPPLEAERGSQWELWPLRMSSLGDEAEEEKHCYVLDADLERIKCRCQADGTTYAYQSSYYILNQ